MRERWWRAAALLAVAVVIVSCGTRTTGGDGSETNFVRCSEDADCPESRCVGGRCAAAVAPAPADEVVGRAGPLGEPLSFVFKAGAAADEQIWLRGSGGALLRISTWDRDPPYTDTCGFSIGQYVDGAGRFGPVRFAPGGRTLLFTESLACDFSTQRYPSRVLAHDLVSGTTRVLLEIDWRPLVLVTNDTAVVVVHHVGRTDPQQAARPEELDLFELVEGALVPIAVPRGDRWLQVRGHDRARLLWWAGRILLLVQGIPALERVDGTWRPSEAIDALVGLDISTLAESPSGTRLCAATSRLREEGGGREDALGWLLSPDGQWISTLLAGTTHVQSCSWAPDETRVLFDSRLYEIGSSGLVPIETPFSPWREEGSFRDGLYAPGPDRSIVRMDWHTLQTETVLTDIPRLCEESSVAPFEPSVPRAIRPIVAPDDRPLAILRQRCGCEDCDISGSLTWNIATGELQLIEEAWGEHQAYGIDWLPDGGAVMLSTQARREDPMQDLEQRPPPGSYFAVSPGGQVELVGPLPGVEDVLHSPRSP